MCVCDVQYVMWD